MSRKSLLLAVLILAVCGVGVMLVAGPAVRQTPPASLNPAAGQLTNMPPALMPAQVAPEMTVPRGSWEGPTVLTSETPLPPLEVLPPAPHAPGSYLMASPPAPRPQVAPKEKIAPPAPDPQLLSARGPAPEPPSTLDMSKMAPAETQRAPMFPRRDRERSLDFVMLYEGFEDGIMPPWGWTQTINNTSSSVTTWHVAGYDPVEGTNIAWVAWDPALVPQDEWLISPMVDLSAGGPWTISFWWVANYAWAVLLDNYDLELRISTDGGITWAPTALWSEDSVGVFTTGEWQFAGVDLSAYSSYSAVKFAWRYAGLNGDNAGLDYIVLADCMPEALPGDSIEVAENPSDTTHYRTDPDGGCNSNPPRWGHTSCGETVYGRCFTYTYPGAYRDLDWYLFTLTESRWVRSTVTARFPVTVWIASLVDTVCSGYTHVSKSGEPCDDVVLDAGCLPAGYYALVVGPSVFEGIEVPSPYRATLECSPCNTRGETCENAIVIPWLPFNDVDVTTGHVNDYDEVCPYGGSTAPDVVYEFTPDADMLLTVDLCPSGYDTKVYVYEGSCVQGTAIACNDDSTECGPAGPESYRSYLADVPVQRWHTYYIVVDGFGNGYGTYDLTVTGRAPQTCPANSMQGQVPQVASGSASTSELAPGHACAQYYDVDYAVTEIHFWGIMAHFEGSWDTCSAPENPMPFLISMYAPNLLTQPEKTCEEYVMLTGVATGDTFGGFWPVYHFSTPISMPCQIGQGYLGIQAAGDTSCWFLWVVAPDDGSPGGVQAPFGGAWGSIGWDFSLCLIGDTVEVPGCPPESTIVSKPPSQRGSAGFALSEAWTGYWCAERFSADGHLFTGMRFYGLSLYASAPCMENPMPFSIEFREDSLGFPGSVACSYTDTLPGRFTGHFYYTGVPVYEYTTYFQSPCHLDEGWISVVGGGETNCTFWWLSTGVAPSDTGTSLQWYPAPESRWDTILWNQSMCLFGDTLILLECPTDLTLFGQTPTLPFETWEAYASDTVWGFETADHFSGISEPIAGVDFWGFHEYVCTEPSMPTRITFYQDNAGQPGAVECSYAMDVAAESTGVSYVTGGGAGPFWLYYHRAVLPTPCNMAQGWVSVQDVSEPNCTFYWMTSGSPGSGSGLYRWGAGPWEALLWDLAFCLLREPSASISGDMNYYNSGLPVPGIVMDIGPGDSVLTEASGDYEFTDLSTGVSYVVTPSCSSETDCDDAIGMYDASLAAQAAIGLIMLDPGLEDAADVSGNGRVTFYDAALIAQYALELITDFPCNCRWLFQPDIRSYIPLTGDQRDQNYIAVCMGDVSADWSGEQFRLTVDLTHELNDAAKPDGAFLARNISERTAFSTEFACRFDPQELHFVTAELVNGLDGWYLYTREETGVVHVGAFGVTPVSAGREIVRLHFEPAGGGPVQCRMDIEGFRINDSPRMSGQVSWVIASPPTEYSLEQNYPNPFNATTRIRYSLPETAHAKLTLFNSLGEQVAVLVDAVQEADHHTVTFDASHLASGIYFYRLDAGGFHKIHKMVLLK